MTQTVTRTDVIEALAELAEARPNDLVRLALTENAAEDPDSLDLRLLSEIKRSDKGAVEIRLINRLAVLELLAKLTGENERDAAIRPEGFFAAIDDAANRISGE